MLSKNRLPTKLSRILPQTGSHLKFAKQYFLLNSSMKLGHVISMQNCSKWPYVLNLTGSLSKVCFAFDQDPAMFETDTTTNYSFILIETR